MKPMLASKYQHEHAAFPLLASTKLDGVRCLIVNGVAVGRSLKPIPNAHVQRLFGGARFDGFDGELIVGEPNASGCFQRTSSGVMSRDGEPNVTFHVFDAWNLFDLPFTERIARVKQTVASAKMMVSGSMVVVPQIEIICAEEIDALAKAYVAAGYEGVMLRRPNSPYKFGRSTAREGYLTKVKFFEDGEAEIIGVTEMMHNENAATTNALGLTERSTKKSGMVASGVLGSITVKDLRSGVQFDIGGGFTAEQRAQLWHADIVGKIVKYKSQPSGVKDKPRFPTFIGFRDAVDMG